MPDFARVVREMDCVGYVNLDTLQFLSEDDILRNYESENLHELKSISITEFNLLTYNQIVTEAPYKRDIQKRFRLWKQINENYN